MLKLLSYLTLENIASVTFWAGIAVMNVGAVLSICKPGLFVPLCVVGSVMATLGGLVWIARDLYKGPSCKEGGGHV